MKKRKAREVQRSKTDEKISVNRSSGTGIPKEYEKKKK